MIFSETFLDYRAMYMKISFSSQGDFHGPDQDIKTTGKFTIETWDIHIAKKIMLIC